MQRCRNLDVVGIQVDRSRAVLHSASIVLQFEVGERTIREQNSVCRGNVQGFAVCHHSLCIFVLCAERQRQ